MAVSRTYYTRSWHFLPDVRAAERRQILATGARSAIFPSSPRRGGRDLNKMSRSLLYGADGVVIKFHRILLRLNTTYYWLRAIALAFAPLMPSARAKDAS